MADNLKATMSPATADLIGSAVSAFLAGKLAIGNGMTLDLPEEIDLTIKAIGGSFVRVALTKAPNISRPGFDVALQHLDVFPSGKVIAEVKRFGVTLEREARSAPMMGLLSAPPDESVFTWTITPDVVDAAWLETIRSAAATAGMTVEQATAAVEAVRAVRTEFPLVPSGGRRARKPSRRQAIAAGMVAAGIPIRWRAVWWVASYFVPAPIRALIDAVIWAVDRYLEVT